MKYYEHNRNAERIQELAKRNATGSPKQLARKMDLSERSLLRLVQAIKEQGVPLEYCRKTMTYFINN